MNKSNLGVLLLILPIIFACAKLDSIIKPNQKEIKPDTIEVDFVSNVETPWESLDLIKEDSIIVGLKDDKGFYIGERFYPTDEAKQLITSLAAKKTPDNRTVYLGASKELAYGSVVSDTTHFKSQWRIFPPTSIAR